MLIAACLAATGCVSDRPAKRDPDPFTSLPSRVPPDQRTVSTNPPSTSAPFDRVTPATLAGSSSRPADGVSGLGIRDGDKAGSPAGAWTGVENKSATPGNGAKLGSPGQRGPTDSFTRPVSATGTGGNGPIVRARSFEEAQQFLMAHGVKWQRLQTTGEGEWTFGCTIPSKANPGSMKTYEAKDRYGLLAMQKVIDEIVRDQGTK